MAIVELVMPKMGESVAEATIINWLKAVGDAVVEDDIILEVATDKVDSEIPSTVSGTLVKILHEVDAVVAVGEVLALIETDGEHVSPKAPSTIAEPIAPIEPIEPSEPQPSVHTPPVAPTRTNQSKDTHRFYAPAVRYTALSHGLSRADLDTINGSGPNGRVTQEDVLTHIESAQPRSQSNTTAQPTAQVSSQNHTTSTFVEIDVTKCQLWALKHDHAINAILLDGVIKALQDHPQINGGSQNAVNIAWGATAHDALMPVLEQAEAYNLSGLIAQLESVDALSTEADSSFSISNTAADTVSNIVTPQLYRDHFAALSLGQITKKPVIQETPEGDIIAIRHMMYVSLSYDHRSVDGSTADAFLNRLTHYIESFDADRSI